MDTLAVVLDAPERIGLRRLELAELGEQDVAVEVEWSAISTGTERLLWSGRMPNFPGLGYPLVPGYEAVGRVVAAGAGARSRLGECVFAPGSTAFCEARGLFGGAARRLVLPASRAVTIPERLAERGVLFALAATARHAVAGGRPPELIIGHGALGRLIARVTIACGAPAPTVWETDAERRRGAYPYKVLHPDEDPRADYGAICDASGDGGLLDGLISRLARGGEVTLAGFYEAPLSFAFPPAFMREARIRVAAEWNAQDLEVTRALVAVGALSLDGLITHRRDASDAENAYRTAFGDRDCLKMVVDWRGCA